MPNVSLSILNSKGDTLCEKASDNHVILVYDEYYQPGDIISLHVSEPNQFYIIQLEDTIGAQLVYITKNKFLYPIPFEKQRTSYNPRAFIGVRHHLYAKSATDQEIKDCHNLAKNRYDIHNNTACYPHAKANVETRNEAVFAARNAIDGIIVTTSHGSYPYASWGINQNSEAEWMLYFGRTVSINCLVLYLRADFPHDSWWNSITVSFSDKSELILDTRKTGDSQTFSFESKEVSWLCLNHLIQADDPSPFPALTQVEVYNKE